MEFKNPQNIKEFIKTEAKNLGFIHIGFTDPTPPNTINNYLNWLKNGHHAKMAYLARPDRLEKIKNPRLILPSCKTIIVFALPYSPPDRKNTPSASTYGRIASYAAGRDYHLVIPELLTQLITKLKQTYPNLDLEYKIMTDSGPILEKAYAQKAGLGWIGKNSCLIIPGYGSYFFLAEILINFELPADQPFEKDYCGKCSACINTCPTSCILNNRTLESKNCISYLTIENKEEIPGKLRKQVGNWIFGCDVCQEACPWNKKSSKSPEQTLFDPMDEFPLVNLESVSPLSPEEFNRKFIDHPIKRTKRKGFYRNLCVVLGNTHSPRFIPFLEKILNQETDPLIINHAQWALDQIYQNLS